MTTLPERGCGVWAGRVSGPYGGAVRWTGARRKTGAGNGPPRAAARTALNGMRQEVGRRAGRVSGPYRRRGALDGRLVVDLDAGGMALNNDNF